VTPLELDQLLYGDEEDHDYTNPPGSAGDEEQISYHLRRGLAYEAEAEQLDALFRAEIKQLQERKNERLRILADKAAWHLSTVESWHRALSRKEGRKAPKTRHLPGGQSALRGKGLEITEPTGDDLDKAMAFLEERRDEDGKPWADAVFRPKRDFLVSELTKRLKEGPGDRPEPGSKVDLFDPESGEAIPGIQAIVVADGYKASPPKVAKEPAT